MADAAAAGFLPTAADDAARQQGVSKFFYLLGDVLGGTDTSLRVDPNNVRQDGLLGPTQSVDVGVDSYGNLYVRGRSTGYGAAQTNTTDPKVTNAAAGVAGISVSPWMMALGALAWLLLKR